ncbi:MAG: SIMPL domain-containing protein [Gemmatimonadaceae bacterium]
MQDFQLCASYWCDKKSGITISILKGNTMKRLVFALFLGISAPVMAQQGNIAASVPQISVSSRGEVKVNPDRASIQMAVQTRAVTAAAAAAENASKQRAVIDALKRLGIDAKDISTSGYNVYPEQRYEPNKEPAIVGYNVTNSVNVELKSLNLVGPAIDAALSKGANMISSLQFYSSNTDAARQEAIAMAVRRARSDADAAAKAAGGSIFGLLEISVGAYYPPPPRPMDMKIQRAEASSADTPISAGDQTVAVDVNTRWQFIAK